MGEGANPGSRIALCLSGGGFRATLFHLGVVKALRAHTVNGEMALKRVAEVYAVSGGSILAAHMLVNWARYTDPDDAIFAEIDQEVRKFAAWSIRDRILRRWFLTRWVGGLVTLLSRVPIAGRVASRRIGLFSRTYWLQKQYESKKLIGKIGLGEANAMTRGLPKFHFLTTSFKTGELCSFSGDEFEIEARDDNLAASGSVVPPPASTPCGHMRLGFAVAASSAFPPMFPPIELTDDLLANPKGDEFLNSICLSDGGVYDNLGIEKFRRNMARNPNHPAKLIISDAGGSFRASAEKSYDNLIARNVRASDILMHRVGDKLKADIGQLQSVDDVTIRISDTIPDVEVDEAIQQRIRLVRTDLDRFDPALAELLVGHGDRLAKIKIEQLFPSSHSGFPVTVPPSTKTTEALDHIARRAANRSFSSLAFNMDWVNPIFLPLFIGVAVSPFAAIGFGVWSYYDKANEAAKLGNQVDAAGRAFSDLQDICLERGRICKPEDYNKVAVALGRAVREVGDAANIVPQRSTPQEGDRSETVLSLPTKYPQRVFIQFAGVLTREQITSLNTELRNTGWNTQGRSGERIATAFGLNEVRYAGENGQAAQGLADAINQAGIPLAKRVGIHRVSIIGTNNLEVWISR